MDSRDLRRLPGLRAAGAACLVLCIGFAAALAWLTHGLQTWTLDERRSAQAAAGSMSAAPVVLRNARGGQFVPWNAASRSAQVYLVDFIYTRCETVCAALGSEFYWMQQEIRARGLEDRVSLLSVSIDPVHDDTSRLADYGSHQRADPAIWHISAPVRSAERGALLRSLDVVAIPDGLGGYVHNGEIHLIDGRGVVLGLYDYRQFKEALEAARRAMR
ncbi:SCO family protein [Burkholderia sp. BCC0397]|uniref:SCO family protein n=1 Tax=Burkholderia sp. BCC0397 TaxID=486876 RepID=UPI001FC837AE|nr:SCO family protein [Burkholderia sp. BCC0397]